MAAVHRAPLRRRSSVAPTTIPPARATRSPGRARSATRLAQLGAARRYRVDQTSRPNPQRACRTPLASQLAGSFPGGFPTPAPVHLVAVATGRHPKPFTQAAVRIRRKVWIVLGAVERQTEGAA